MRQKEVSKWLKGITIAVGCMGIVFFCLILPVLAGEMRDAYPEVNFLYWPGMIYGWIIGVGCYIVLFLFWKVCNEIGKDNSFSKENAHTFVQITRIALVLAFVWFAGFTMLSFKHWVSPAIAIFMIFAVLISIIVAILAAAMSHLILKAYEMKQENELTI